MLTGIFLWGQRPVEEEVMQVTRIALWSSDAPFERSWSQPLLKIDWGPKWANSFLGMCTSTVSTLTFSPQLTQTLAHKLFPDMNGYGRVQMSQISLWQVLLQFENLNSWKTTDHYQRSHDKTQAMRLPSKKIHTA